MWIQVSFQWTSNLQPFSSSWTNLAYSWRVVQDNHFLFLSSHKIFRIISVLWTYVIYAYTKTIFKHQYWTDLSKKNRNKTASICTASIGWHSTIPTKTHCNYRGFKSSAIMTCISCFVCLFCCCCRRRTTWRSTEYIHTNHTQFHDPLPQIIYIDHYIAAHAVYCCYGWLYPCRPYGILHRSLCWQFP